MLDQPADRQQASQRPPRADPVKVDVGVVCLSLGPVTERRNIARQLAHDLLARADKLMYEAKGQRASHIYLVRVRVENGELVEIGDDPDPVVAR